MHLYNNRNRFIDLNNIKPRSVRIANTNAALRIAGISTVYLDVDLDNGTWNRITLSNVIYSPDAICSLVSVLQITKQKINGLVNKSIF